MQNVNASFPFKKSTSKQHANIQAPSPYQSLNMYVPPDETVQDLGEINMNFQGDATPRGAGAGTVINPVYGK